MFYKQLDDNTISYGPYVQSQYYTLDQELINEYPTPLPDGWIWFETNEEASSYFGIEIV